jgi:hypothetical protein
VDGILAAHPPQPANSVRRFLGASFFSLIRSILGYPNNEFRLETIFFQRISNVPDSAYYRPDHHRLILDFVNQQVALNKDSAIAFPFVHQLAAQ